MPYAPGNDITVSLHVAIFLVLAPSTEANAIATDGFSAITNFIYSYSSSSSSRTSSSKSSSLRISGSVSTSCSSASSTSRFLILNLRIHLHPLPSILVIIFMLWFYRLWSNILLPQLLLQPVQIRRYVPMDFYLLASGFHPLPYLSQLSQLFPAFLLQPVSLVLHKTVSTSGSVTESESVKFIRSFSLTSVRNTHYPEILNCRWSDKKSYHS